MSLLSAVAAHADQPGMDPSQPWATESRTNEPATRGTEFPRQWSDLTALESGLPESLGLNWLDSGSSIGETPRTAPVQLASYDSDSLDLLATETLNDATFGASSANDLQSNPSLSSSQVVPIRVGYDGGFVIASQDDLDLGTEHYPYRLKLNGWGQLRQTVFAGNDSQDDLNQIQLKRARIILSGNAISSDLSYYVQLDGRSNASDSIRILDYYFQFDLAHRLWDCDRGTLGIRTGLYKMPFSLARQLSGKHLQFSDRSMSSTYFDVNRSLALGFYGATNSLPLPIHWELALFNGLVTGGAETGSSGQLDNNNAFSGRLHFHPTGQWGPGQLADLTGHRQLATRVGAGFATTTIDRSGTTEFSSIRTVDSGHQLSNLLPFAVKSYDVSIFSLDTSMKYRGFSATGEYYFRNITGFQGDYVPNLFDHGFWLQSGMFVVPHKMELMARWSRVNGNSGTLGVTDQSSDEFAGGWAWYFDQDHAKVTMDATYLNGATVNSAVLDINPGDKGWLVRTQLQISF
ncbi:porin family protein [Rubripirellula lacrimiformis]|nr:hypothetical protein [Rubripirellula lacrimiformis]